MVSIGFHVEGFKIDLLSLFNNVLDPAVVILFALVSDVRSPLFSVPMSRAQVELTICAISMGRILSVGSDLNLCLFLMVLEYSGVLGHNIPLQQSDGYISRKISKRLLTSWLL